MTRDALKNMVRARIDELSPFTDTNLNPGIDLIEQLLDDSARTVVMLAPLHLLTPTTISGTPVVDSPTTGVITIPLSSDFLKLHSVKLTDWSKEVTDPITVDDPKYKLQSYPTLRGGADKPIVVLKSGEIECYSYSTLNTVEYQKYIPFTVAEAVDDTILTAVAWQCAADVIGAMKGDPKLALLKVEEFLKIN